MNPIDKRHPHEHYPDDAYPRSAEEDDARLQPDPELALSTGRASSTQKWLVALSAAVVAGLVLYGISQPARDSQTAATPPAPAETTGAAQPQDTPRTAPGQQPEQQAAPEQSAPEQAKPGPSDSAR